MSGDPDYYSSKTPTFTLNAPTKSGYTFIGWSGTDLDGNENKTVTVTIGSTGDRTYTAHWTRNSSGGGGGGTVDLTQYVPERSGHVFTGWYADAALTQPIERVTLSASMTVYAGWRAETGELPFTDVGADAWYRDDVQYVYDKGLMTGMTADRFAPNEGMTRAMLVTVLWRQAGSPVVNDAMDFSDVAEGAWYAEAVRWAAAGGRGRRLRRRALRAERPDHPRAARDDPLPPPRGRRPGRAGRLAAALRRRGPDQRPRRARDAVGGGPRGAQGRRRPARPAGRRHQSAGRSHAAPGVGAVRKKASL